MVTSNHVHLLVRDTAEGVIARSIQLIAGRAAQDYNRRKARLGAFWEDRYHTTAIESGTHLHRCVVYIDFNMVRAGGGNSPGSGITLITIFSYRFFVSRFACWNSLTLIDQEKRL
jgi:putative transposase